MKSSSGFCVWGVAAGFRRANLYRTPPPARPQPVVMIWLSLSACQNGMQTLRDVKSDGRRKFNFNREAPARTRCCYRRFYSRVRHTTLIAHSGSPTQRHRGESFRFDKRRAAVGRAAQALFSLKSGDQRRGSVSDTFLRQQDAAHLARPGRRRARAVLCSRQRRMETPQVMMQPAPNKNPENGREKKTSSGGWAAYSASTRGGGRKTAERNVYKIMLPRKARRDFRFDVSYRASGGSAFDDKAVTLAIPTSYPGLSRLP